MAKSLRIHLFQAWFRMSRSMTIGVRGIVENERGEVLLVRHTYIPGLHFPGGGIERGETAAVSLERELVEEAGVKLTEPGELIGIFSNHANFANDHVLVFRVHKWQACKATSRGEIAERLWVDPLNPPEDTTQGTRNRLTEIYLSKEVTSLW